MTDDIKYILSLPSGRRVLWHLLSKTMIFQQPAAFGDTERTYFNCGMVNVGLDIWAELLEASPDHVALMQKEAADEWNRERGPDDGNAGGNSDDTEFVRSQPRLFE